MTIDDAMEALAEALEPNPLPWDGEWTGAPYRKFWLLGYSTEIGRHWRPVDFIHFEDASAKLLDAMPPLLIAKCQQRSPGEAIQWDVQAGGNHELSDDRKAAIFLAALAWKGIERPEVLK